MRINRFYLIKLFLCFLFVDVFSKFIADAYLPRMEFSSALYPYGGIGVFKDFLGIEFSITHHINTGAAWGMLAEYQVYLLIFRITLVLGMCLYLFKYHEDKRGEIPLLLIITGAVGNILDFFIYGHVVDIFHFILWGYDYPVFNVADSLIFCGVFMLFIRSFLEKK